MASSMGAVLAAHSVMSSRRLSGGGGGGGDGCGCFLVAFVCMLSVLVAVVVSVATCTVPAAKAEEVNHILEVTPMGGNSLVTRLRFDDGTTCYYRGLYALSCLREPGL